MMLSSSSSSSPSSSSSSWLPSCLYLFPESRKVREQSLLCSREKWLRNCTHTHQLRQAKVETYLGQRDANPRASFLFDGLTANELIPLFARRPIAASRLSIGAHRS